MTADAWLATLAPLVDEGALLLIGPGAPDPLPPAAIRRHVPPGTLIPLAEGARLANPDRPVVIVGGDADLYGLQLGDLLHAVRRNATVVCIVADNGLAAGTAATAGAGQYPLMPLLLALAAGSTFVAQGLSNKRLLRLADLAFHHPGFALVNVLERPFDPSGMHILDGEWDHDEFDQTSAMEWAADPDRVATGVFYREPDRDALEAVVLPRTGPGQAAAWNRALYLTEEGV